MTGSRVITKKSAADFEKMKIAGQCVAAMHDAVRGRAEPGARTSDLDEAARDGRPSLDMVVQRTLSPV